MGAKAFKAGWKDRDLRICKSGGALGFLSLSLSVGDCIRDSRVM